MTWSAEIEAGFGDLLSEVGEPVQWTDCFGVLHINDDGTFPEVLFKAPGSLVLSDMSVSDEWAMEYRVADFPGIRSGDLVVARYKSFRFREVLQGDDPVLRVARLTRLTESCWR